MNDTLRGPRPASRRSIAAALLALVAGLLVVPAAPSFAADPAFIRVSLTFGDVSGCNFTPDGTVTVTIKSSPAGSVLFAGPAGVDSGGCFLLEGDETEEWPLAAGNFVSVTDGVATKDLTLEPVAIAVISTVTDEVSGTAAPGEHLRVEMFDGSDWVLETEADGTGNWTVDFSGTRDITGHSSLSAIVYDGDGDGTSADREAPHIEADLTSDGVFGCGYAAGNVTVRIRTAPGGTVLFTGTAPTFDGCFGMDSDTHGQDLVPGMNVRVTQGGSVAADLTLAQLSLDLVDAATDVVSGTAAPGALLFVHFNGPSGEGEAETTADGAGDWSVDFTGIGDVVPQTFATAEIEDDDGDSTQATFVAPFIVGNLTTDEVSGCGWHNPATLTIRTAAAGAVLFSGPVAPDGVGCFEAGTSLHGQDLFPTRFVQLSDGTVTRSITLVGVTVDAADAAAGTSEGTAPPGATVIAGFSLPGRGDGSAVTADGTGHWSWSFGEPIAGEPGEPDPIFFAEVADADGDVTHAELVEAAPCTKVGSTLMLEPGIFTIANNGGAFQVTGAGVSDPTCGGATMTNINLVQAAGGTGNESLTINLAGGPIGPGMTAEGSGVSEIELTVDFVSGDSLIVQGGTGNDTISFGAAGVGLNNDADADVTNPTTPGSLGSVALHGAGGQGDRIMATEDANITLTNGLLTVGSRLAGISTFELATLTGGVGNNTLNASGFTGMATLAGLGGLDTLTGGPNSDSLNGGSGDDVLTGNAGSNTLIGDAGIDRVTETGNFNMTLTNTSLFMATGTDSLSGMERATLTGGGSPNVLNAQAFTGMAILSGLGGPDTLTGGSNNDTLLGGTDNDILSGRGGGNSVNGEAGSDQVIYNWTNGAVNVNLSSGGASGPGFGDVLSNVERVLGSNFNDSLVGNGLPNILEGAGGNDLIDTRDGIRGNDTANGGGGTDTCRTDLNDGRTGCEAS